MYISWKGVFLPAVYVQLWSGTLAVVFNYSWLTQSTEQLSLAVHVHKREFTSFIGDELYVDVLCVMTVALMSWRWALSLHLVASCLQSIPPLVGVDQPGALCGELGGSKVVSLWVMAYVADPSKLTGVLEPKSLKNSVRFILWIWGGIVLREEAIQISFTLADGGSSCRLAQHHGNIGFLCYSAVLLSSPVWLLFQSWAYVTRELIDLCYVIDLALYHIPVRSK